MPQLFANLKDDLKAASLEFLGTTLFLLLGLGGIQAAAFSNSETLAAAVRNGGAQAVNTVASIEQLLYIAVSMGLSLLISVWVFYRVTGGVFNPAVATSLMLVGAIGPVRWALYCIAEIVGAITASALLLALLPGPLAVTPSPGPRVSDAQAVWIEAFLTAALCLTVLMLAVEKHKATAVAPVTIGLTLFACHLFGVVYTGAGMNAARSFGPAVVSGFDKSHWVYWVGPFIGSLIAVGIYFYLKFIDYPSLNPGQDTDDTSKSPRWPGKRSSNDESRQSESTDVFSSANDKTRMEIRATETQV